MLIMISNSLLSLKSTMKLLLSPPSSMLINSSFSPINQPLVVVCISLLYICIVCIRRRRVCLRMLHYKHHIHEFITFYWNREGYRQLTGSSSFCLSLCFYLDGVLCRFYWYWLLVSLFGHYFCLHDSDMYLTTIISYIFTTLWNSCRMISCGYSREKWISMNTLNFNCYCCLSFCPVGRT